MKQKEILAFAKEAAKSMKTEKDLSDFSRMLKKVTVEAALGAELDDHLGYDIHQTSPALAQTAVTVIQVKPFIQTTERLR